MPTGATPGSLLRPLRSQRGAFRPVHQTIDKEVDARHFHSCLLDTPHGAAPAVAMRLIRLVYNNLPKCLYLNKMSYKKSHGGVRDACIALATTSQPLAAPRHVSRAGTDRADCGLVTLAAPQSVCSINAQRGAQPFAAAARGASIYPVCFPKASHTTSPGGTGFRSRTRVGWRLPAGSMPACVEPQGELSIRDVGLHHLSCPQSWPAKLARKAGATFRESRFIATSLQFSRLLSTHATILP